MRTFPGIIAIAFFSACGSREPSPVENTLPSPTATPIGFAPLALKEVDDNLHHDTLLIQVTFDLGDGSFVMVASNMEETFEGVRLYRYRFEKDSALKMIAVSSPAYDSWTMLPTFFA